MHSETGWPKTDEPFDLTKISLIENALLSKLPTIKATLRDIDTPSMPFGTKEYLRAISERVVTLWDFTYLCIQNKDIWNKAMPMLQFPSIDPAWSSGGKIYNAHTDTSPVAYNPGKETTLGPIEVMTKILFYEEKGWSTQSLIQEQGFDWLVLIALEEEELNFRIAIEVSDSDEDLLSWEL